MSKKGLMVVSFGTSVEETRERTIGAIERSLAEAFPEYKLYRAWTSGVIRRKLMKTVGLHIDSVEEALERMAADGVEEVLVQPTHLLDGEENRLMTEAVQAAAGRFSAVRIGAPLLVTPADLEALADAAAEICPELEPDQLFAWMGHGSSELKENVYVALNELFAREGRGNMVVGTVEFEPGFAPIEDCIREKKPAKVYLAPLMVVAGDHAVNDMSGDEEDSWKSLVAKLGAEPACILKGLGEFEAIRRLYVRHAQNAAAL